MTNLQTQMKGLVAQWRKAADDLESKGFYSRGLLFRPRDGGGPYYVDVYVKDIEGNARLLCYNCTPHRARQLLKYYQTDWFRDLDPAIIDSYKRNGYATRRGLKANYEKLMPKIKAIQKSHDTIEATGKAAHEVRVILRNN